MWDSLAGALVENDISLSEDTIRAQRNFANKIWNMGRFIQIMVESYGQEVPFFDKKKMGKGLKEEDIEILDILEKTTNKVTKNIDKFILNEAADLLYHFMWDSLAATYIEKVKNREDKGLALSVLRHVYITGLHLLHPFMPFITEAIWKEIGSLRNNPEELLITSHWPK
jgi:valyl-tRNA synthetase